MSQDEDTVELPANSEIKQLSHDIAREENEYAVPIILDLYSFLSKLKEDEPVRPIDIRVENPRSKLGSDEWSTFLKLLHRVEIVEQGSDAQRSYVLRDGQDGV